jgi:hypothetical protein
VEVEVNAGYGDTLMVIHGSPWRGEEGTPKGEWSNIAAPFSDSPLELACQGFSD